MSARVLVKKYVVCIRTDTEGGTKKNFRSIPMALEQAMHEIADYARTGTQAWHEEANDADLNPIAVKKQRTKERKARKKDIEARRLVP